MSEEDSEYDCEIHETDFPTGYDHCPYCREERRVNAMEQELMERRADPNMHPSVDAPMR